MSDLRDAIGRAILAESAVDEPLAVVRRAAEADLVAGDLLQEAVTSARAGGQSWASIGDVLGLSRQAAQQRFGKAGDGATDPPAGAEERWLGPVTAFDEMAELALAGDRGWHTIGAGMLRHRMIRGTTRWEHKRTVWTAPVRRYEADGWQIGCRAFPWVYLVRDTGEPVRP